MTSLPSIYVYVKKHSHSQDLQQYQAMGIGQDDNVLPKQTHKLL